MSLRIDAVAAKIDFLKTVLDLLKEYNKYNIIRQGRLNRDVE
jgi:hypothetical protein